MIPSQKPGIESPTKAMAADPSFRRSLWVTVIYVFVTVPLKLAFALAIAL